MFNRVYIPIFNNIIKYIDDYNNMQNLSNVNKNMNVFVKNNKIYKFLKFFKKYNIKFKDPTNFIYLYNNVHDIEQVYSNGIYDFQKIKNLYMKCFNTKSISCENMGITSFPIYPNLVYLNISYNKLEIFPSQPKLLWLYANDNRLTQVFKQPKMTRCRVNFNYLEYIDIQENMEDFEGCYNKFKHFPVQPEMKYCKVSNNLLEFFPSQPEMIVLEASYNKLKSISFQPKMKSSVVDHNLLPKVVLEEKKLEINTCLNPCMHLTTSKFYNKATPYEDEDINNDIYKMINSKEEFL